MNSLNHDDLLAAGDGTVLSSHLAAVTLHSHSHTTSSHPSSSAPTHSSHAQEVDAATHEIATQPSAAITAAKFPSPSAVSAADVGTDETTLDLIDYKLVSGKGGDEYVIFLFELVYHYPLSSLHFIRQQLHPLLTHPTHPIAEPPSVVDAVSGKRFSELHAFHAMLERNFVCLPPFPSRTLTHRFDKTFLLERCAALQYYFRMLLLREDIMKSNWLQKFFSIPTPAARVRQAQAAHNTDTLVLHSPVMKKKSSNAHPKQLHRTRTDSTTQPPASRYDSALNDEGATDGIEVHASNGHTETREESTHRQFDVEQEEEEVEQVEEEEADNSNPSTHSSSFADAASTAAAGYTEFATSRARANSDDEFEKNLKGGDETEEEKKRRKKEGSRVHEQRATGDAATSPSASLPLSSTAADSVPFTGSALEFITRSPVFNFLSVTLIDSDTLLAVASDQSVVSKMDSWLNSIFSTPSKKNRPSVSASYQVTDHITSASSARDCPAPIAALYCFRRKTADRNQTASSSFMEADYTSTEISNVNSPSGSIGVNDVASSSTSDELNRSAAADDDWREALCVFFPIELTAVRWDPHRRFIYVADREGSLHIFNTSRRFDYALRILSVQIFAQPLTHLVLYTPPPAATSDASSAPSSSSSSFSSLDSPPATYLLLFSAPNATLSDSSSRHLFAAFHLDSQSVVQASRCQLNSGAQAKQTMKDVAIDEQGERMFVATQDRMILIYALTPLTHSETVVENEQTHASFADAITDDAAPSTSRAPYLLHRLACGHRGAILSLSFLPSVPSRISRVTRGRGLLVSGGDDGQVVWWSVGDRGSESDTKIWARGNGHTSRVCKVKWQDQKQTKDDETSASSPSHPRYWLVSGDADGHICVWDTRRKGCRLAFRAHTSAINDLQLTSTLQLITAAQDKAGKIWQLG